MIMVDTSIWIRATRVKDGAEARELDSLLARYEVATTEVVIAEVLQGTANRDDFDRYMDQMTSSLEYFPATRETWLAAAELSFNLRRQGLATPLADLVIATVALENDLPVFTADDHFTRVPGLNLHQVSL
jgi:predicted nucleic acid-binding protein